MSGWHRLRGHELQSLIPNCEAPFRAHLVASVAQRPCREWCRRSVGKAPPAGSSQWWLCTMLRAYRGSRRTPFWARFRPERLQYPLTTLMSPWLSLGLSLKTLRSAHVPRLGLHTARGERRATLSGCLAQIAVSKQAPHSCIAQVEILVGLNPKCRSTLNAWMPPLCKACS